MMLKITAAAALLAASLSASAMTAIADEDLSAVSGQDGVSIAADLNINIGAFTYTDTDTNGGSVSFNKISISGLMVMTIDVLNGATFTAAAGTSIATRLGGAFTTTDAVEAAKVASGAESVAAAIANGATAVGLTTASILSDVAKASGYGGQDVVQFAFPTIDAAASKVTPTITVGSITTGGTYTDPTGATHASGYTPSFGSITITNLDLQGTKVWMYAH